MSNLILSFISIALIAATAAATVFFGGDAVRGGTAQAGAATLQNIGSQVSGYNQMYWATSGEDASDVFNPDEGVDETTLEGSGFLRVSDIALPYEDAEISLDGSAVLITNIPAEVCDAVNENAGLDSKPAALENVDRAYACFGSGDQGTFVFK